MNCMAAAGRPEEAGAACFEEVGLDYEPVQVRILSLKWFNKQTLIPTLTVGLCRKSGRSGSALPEWRNPQCPQPWVRMQDRKKTRDHDLLTRAYGVPWPTWDGVGGDEVIEEVDVLGIVGYLCKYYYDGDLPGGVCEGGRKDKMGLTYKN